MQATTLPREWIEQEMRRLDPEGFDLRRPSSQKHRIGAPTPPVVFRGPHKEWSGIGLEKLSDIGFSIWGIRDVWSGKWLGLWVIPSSNLKTSVAYLYLKLVKQFGGNCLGCSRMGCPCN